MKIKLVGSTVGDGPQYHFASTYLVNDTVAIDAGTIGLISPLSVQKGIRNVLLSHSHIDHLATLPLFLDSVFEPGDACPAIYASPCVHDSLRQDLFNDRIWPDLMRLSQSESPFFKPHAIVAEEPLLFGDLTITPIELNHVVPTLGFILSDETSTVAIVSDTAPTERVWEVARGLPNLQAVFLECAFPNTMAWLAEKSMHLTPTMFASELRKMGRPVRTIAVHIKPAFHGRILDELAAMELANVEVGVPESCYSF